MNRLLGCLLAIGFLMLATGVALLVIQKPVNQTPPEPPVQAAIPRPVPEAPPEPLLNSTPAVVNTSVSTPKKTPKRIPPKAKRHFLPPKIAAKLHVLLPGVPLPAAVQVSTNSAR